MPRKKKATNMKNSAVKNPESLQTPGTSSSKTVQNVTSCKNLEVDESSKLLSVFPEEIWLIILAKLKNTQDVTTVSNSSLFFRNLLLPNRASFLFPLVWKVLGMKYERETHDVYEEDKQSVTLKQSRVNSGNSRRIASHSVIMKLRQVCRTWCDGVDQFYQNLASNFRMNHDATHPLKLECKWNSCWSQHEQDGCWSKRYALFEVRDLNKFNTHFEQTHQNQDHRSPFLSNEICLSVKAGQEYTSTLETLLMNYSKHIWYCNMLVDQREMTLLEIYTKLRRFLELLPNLVGLRILIASYSAEDVQSREFRQLNRNILRNPLPTLSKLKYLKTEDLPFKMADQLITQNRHIEMLEAERQLIDSCSIFSDETTSSRQSVNHSSLEHHGIFSALMPNLSQIALDISSKSEFQKLRNVSWNLEKLYLDFHACCYIPWSQIFQLVEQKFGQTVSEIMIGLPSSKTPAEIQQHIQEHDSLRLNLPKAKRLRIQLGNYSSIDFILPMKDSLKQVDISEAYNDYKFEFKKMWEHTGFQQTVEQNSVIKYPYPDQEDEYDANIWEMFPKLEVLEYFEGPTQTTPHPDIYSRSDWIRAQTDE